MKCLNCGSDNMTIIQKTRGISLAGILGAILFLFGLIAMLFSPIPGLLVIVAGFAIATFGRGKSNIAVCLNCRSKTPL